MRSLLTLSLLFFAAAQSAVAQDAVAVDAKHYKVEFENDQVRVLRITYGPHEKSVMHEHPMAVGIAISELAAKFTFPDGKAEERRQKAGQALWYPAEKHLPENLSDKPLEVVLVELKAKQAK